MSDKEIDKEIREPLELILDIKPRPAPELAKQRETQTPYYEWGAESLNHS